MKKLLFVTIVFCCMIGFAQKSNEFFRIYDFQGKKIAKGEVISLLDSTLVLKKRKNSISIPIHKISHIKTKRSAGSGILTGASTGILIGGILGVATADSDGSGFLNPTPGEGALIFGGLFGFIGGQTGGLIHLLKSKKTYLINGNIDKWKEFKKTYKTVNH